MWLCVAFTVSERDREQGAEWMFILASNQLELSVLGYVPDASATWTAPARTSGGCQIHSLHHDTHPFQVNEFLQIVMITTTMTCYRKRRMRKLLEQKLRRRKTRDSPSSLNSTLDQLSFSSRYNKQSENLHTFGNTFLLYSSQAFFTHPDFQQQKYDKTYSG
jgi:hypothetical protein